MSRHESSASSAASSRAVSPVLERRIGKNLIMQSPMGISIQPQQLGRWNKFERMATIFGKYYMPYVAAALGVTVGGPRIVQAYGNFRQAQPVQVVPKSNGYVEYHGMNRREEPKANYSLDFEKYIPTPTPSPVPVNGTNPLNTTQMNTTNSTDA